jgi:hypothetical protein
MQWYHGNIALGRCLAIALALLSVPVVANPSSLVSLDGAQESALIQKQVNGIIELKPIGMEFYTSIAKKVGKAGGANCILGGLAGAILSSFAGPVAMGLGAVKGCAMTGFATSLLMLIDAPFAHWSTSMRAAYRARKAYELSFQWLDIDAFELLEQT